MCDLWSKKLRSIRLPIIVSKMENFAPTFSGRFAIHRLSKVRQSDIFWKPAWRLPGWRSRVACVRVPPHKAARCSVAAETSSSPTWSSTESADTRSRFVRNACKCVMLIPMFARTLPRAYAKSKHSHFRGKPGIAGYRDLFELGIYRVTGSLSAKAKDIRGERDSSGSDLNSIKYSKVIRMNCWPIRSRRNSDILCWHSRCRSSHRFKYILYKAIYGINRSIINYIFRSQLLDLSLSLSLSLSWRDCKPNLLEEERGEEEIGQTYWEMMQHAMVRAWNLLDFLRNDNFHEQFRTLSEGERRRDGKEGSGSV